MRLPLGLVKTAETGGTLGTR